MVLPLTLRFFLDDGGWAGPIYWVHTAIIMYAVVVGLFFRFTKAVVVAWRRLPWSLLPSAVLTTVCALSIAFHALALTEWEMLGFGMR